LVITFCRLPGFFGGCGVPPKSGSLRTPVGPATPVGRIRSLKKHMGYPCPFVHSWAPSVVHTCRGAGYWPCPQLAPRRLTGARLRRLAPGGSWWGMRWLLSRKVGGLVTGTCGLGGPHYGEEQSAELARWYVSRSMGCARFELIGSLCYSCGARMIDRRPLHEPYTAICLAIAR
jgi:hypothetical protein